MSPAPHRKRERCLDEIVRGCVDNTPAQGQVGVYRTQNRIISVGHPLSGYLHIPQVVEAVIKNYSVMQLTDLRINR